MGQNLSYYRGDSINLTVNFADSSGTAVNISGCEVFFTVKAQITDPDSAALVAISQTSHTNPAQGQTLIQVDKGVTAAMNGNYRYDMKLKRPDGSIYTIISGTVRFSPDVTLRTS